MAGNSSKRRRSTDQEESLEQLFAATALGEDPLCRALKRLHTAHDEPSAFSNLQTFSGQGDDAESSAATSRAPSVPPDRRPVGEADRKLEVSSGSRTTGVVPGPSCPVTHEPALVPRAGSSMNHNLDSSSDSESEASVTRWRPAGPSAGTSAAESGHSTGWVGAHAQADTDSATSQRFLLPRFVISTRTRPGDAAPPPHPQLQPLPLRPHTAQFHPSQASAGAGFPLPVAAADAAMAAPAPGPAPPVWPGLGDGPPQRGAAHQDGAALRGPVRVAGRRVRGRNEEEARPVAGERRRAGPLDHPVPVAPALRVRPPGLRGDEEGQAEVDGMAAADQGAGAEERPRGAEPAAEEFIGVGPRLANLGYNAIMDELPGRLERIQVAGDPASGDVAHPTTPTREECLSPIQGRARPVGVRAFHSADSAYDSLYEQTNTLLKNLHFERVKRWSRPSNPSPFPS